MIVNNSLTVYHKNINKETRLEEWEKFNYSDVWLFGGKGAGINKGYENANDVDIRIPYEKNSNLSIDNFKIGDIVVRGSLDFNINTQQDIGKQYEVYNITSINNNNFGINRHIHLGGK